MPFPSSPRFYLNNLPPCSAFEESAASYLYSILIKGLFLSHHFLIRGQSSAYLNDCSLVPSFEERILERERPADQRRAVARLNALCLCLDSVMMCVIKNWWDVGNDGGGIQGCCSKRYGFPSSACEQACGHALS